MNSYTILMAHECEVLVWTRDSACSILSGTHQEQDYPKHSPNKSPNLCLMVVVEVVILSNIIPCVAAEAQHEFAFQGYRVSFESWNRE